MAERLRHDDATYFVYLVRDVAQMIDRMVHPISSGPLVRLQRIDFPVYGLARGQELISSTSEWIFRSIPEGAVTTSQAFTRTREFIDLGTPTDAFPVYSDQKNLRIGRMSYCLYQKWNGRPGSGVDIWRSEQYNQTGLTHHRDQIVRGAAGFIYFLYKDKVYRLHLNTPTEVEPVTLNLPRSVKNITMLFASPRVNSLVVFTSEGLYRCHLETKMAVLVASPSHVKYRSMDPTTGLMYYVIRKWPVPWEDFDLKLVRETGTVVLDVMADLGPLVPPNRTFSFDVKNFYITTGGQVILEVCLGHQTTSYLYG